jgi:uncharacterized protein (DUF1919 family)
VTTSTEQMLFLHKATGSMTLKKQLRRYRDSFYSYKKNVEREISRSRLKDRDFTIISNNCWGSEVYRDLGLPYQTPFVGLFLFAPCYIQLLNNLKFYLEGELNFKEFSRYELANQKREKGIWALYPIGLLGDDVEIHFMHYSSDSEAREKWFRRLKRIHWDTENIFLKFCDRGLCTEQLIAEFDQLNFSQKVCFTSKNYPDFKSAVWVKECRNAPYVVDGSSLYRVSREYFDVIDWLNGGSGHVKITQKIFNRVLL